MSKKQEINEEELMAMMAEPFSVDRKFTELEKPVEKGIQKITSKPKAEQDISSYQEQFLQKSGLTARKGKTAYIRTEYHEILTRIVQVIGENKVAMSDLLDQILAHHFSEFEAEIKKSFNKKNKPIL